VAGLMDGLDSLDVLVKNAAHGVEVWALTAERQ
jgi:hypothetical protein